MANSNTTVTASGAINDFINQVVNPAYNSCVFWNGNYPSGRINTGALGPRDITRPTAANLSGNLAATNLVNILRTYAFNTTVYRRARSGLLTSRSHTRYTYDFVSGRWVVAERQGTWYVGDRTDVCRLIDSYRINYGNSTISGTVTANNFNNLISNFRTRYQAAQQTAGVVDLRVCHDSCHSSCHGSRGRR